MDASAETHASAGRRSSDCVVVFRRCFRACRLYSCRTDNTRQHPQWWLFIHLLTAICADEVCAVKCSSLRLEPVFWITSRPRLACSNHCNHVDSLSWEEKGALVFVEYGIRIPLRFPSAGDEPDCGLRREADETTDSLDNQESPLKSSPEDDPGQKCPMNSNATNTFRCTSTAQRCLRQLP